MARPRKSLQLVKPESPLAVLYTRVSTKEQEDEGYSIEAQLALLRSYCESRGLTIVKEFTEAETAKTTGREAFSAMVRMIRKGGAGAIVVEKTDRIYRNLRDRVTIDELNI